MKKNKAITLLTILCIVLAAVLVMTFVRFSVGTKKYNSVLGAISFDYDMDGGETYVLEYQKDNVKSVNDDNVQDVIKTLSYRMNELGYKAYGITAVREKGISDYNFRIEAKGNNLSSDIAVVAAYGTIKFYGKNGDADEAQILTDIKNPVADCVYAGATKTTEGTTYTVNLTLSDEAHKAIKEAIKGAESYTLTIKLGDETIMSGSVNESTFESKTLSLTAGSETAGKQLALKLRSGGLDYKYEISEDSPYIVSPTLGKNAVMISEIILGVSVLAVVIALLVMYKGFGIISMLSALTFVVAVLGLLVAIPGITLSVSGIVGLVGAILMFADGMIITAKRIKEEFVSGKTVKASIKVGYKRALIPILSTNIIAVVASLLIFFICGGAVQSFAITLGVGTAVSFICTVLISRMFTALIMPIVKNQESFLNFKRVGNGNEE